MSATNTSSNTSNTSVLNTAVLHSPITKDTAVAYLTIMALLGTIGNILVIASVAKTIQLQRFTYMLIANLSLVGLLVCVVVIPSHIFNIVNAPNDKMSGVLCRFEGYLNFMLTLVMVVNSNAIAVYRYLVVSRQGSTLQREQHSDIVLVLTFIWLVPIVLAFTSLPYVGYHKLFLDCFFTSSEESYRYTIVIISGPGILTIVCISTFYALILRTVRKSRQKVTANVPRTTSIEDLNTSVSEETSQVAKDIRNSLQLFAQDGSNSPRHSTDNVGRHSLAGIQVNRSPLDATKNDNQTKFPRHDSSKHRLSEIQISVTRASSSIRTDSLTSTSRKISIAVGSKPKTSRLAKSKFRQEARLTLQLCLVFALFVVMYVPICVIDILEMLMPLQPDVCLVVFTVARSFPTLTWMLYGMLNRDFQEAYARILMCKR